MIMTFFAFRPGRAYIAYKGRIPSEKITELMRLVAQHNIAAPSLLQVFMGLVLVGDCCLLLLYFVESFLF
jgi:hypothetical protein